VEDREDVTADVASFRVSLASRPVWPGATGGLGHTCHACPGCVMRVSRGWSRVGWRGTCKKILGAMLDVV